MSSQLNLIAAIDKIGSKNSHQASSKASNVSPASAATPIDEPITGRDLGDEHTER